MNKKNVFIGIGLILIGVWFYSSLGSFEVEEDSFPQELIIREGTVRTEREIAEALSKEAGFDLEGAYKTGYTPMDVIDYLMNQPHKLSVTNYKGRFYLDRKTVPYIIPLAICILIILTGIIITLYNLKSRKP